MDIGAGHTRPVRLCVADPDAEGILVVVLELVAPAGTDVHIEAAPGQAVEVGRAAFASRGLGQDPHMSARHFAVVWERDQCHVQDLGSTNGTFVNGARVAASVIRDGDRIEAGSCTFVVRAHRSTGPPLEESPTRTGSGQSFGKAPSNIGARAPGAGTQAVNGPAARLRAPFYSIESHTPFPLATMAWEDTAGAPRLSIIVKATFTIASQPCAADRQLPLFAADVVGDQPGSVRFESDFVPFKPRTDVVLVGRAYAPGGTPVTQLMAGLRVGSLRYGAIVFGDRAWQWRPIAAPTISEPELFTTMSFVYERAFGGIDGPGAMYCKENLAGTGFIGKKTARRVSGLALPNIEDPRDVITAWDTHPRPAGFGFYGRGCMPRLGYAGTYDDQYMKDRHPLPPTDFSYRFFNGAHPDLQMETYLQGNEEVVLANVCPRDPHVVFRLPGIVPKITVARWTVPPEQWIEDHLQPDGTLPSPLPLAEEAVKPALDTLVFVPDEGIFYEVFRSVCNLSSLASLEVARITVEL